ncbi:MULTISPECIES: hypothetical protein [Enorma]|uniref:hypothetical protein n=1 Tax=Enorma TaxID=1472762 RepID=UPI0012B92C1F|nr:MULTISPECIES: hypothetical protein [Enorma]
MVESCPSVGLLAGTKRSIGSHTAFCASLSIAAALLFELYPLTATSPLGFGLFLAPPLPILLERPRVVAHSLFRRWLKNALALIDGCGYRGLMAPSVSGMGTCGNPCICQLGSLFQRFQPAIAHGGVIDPGYSVKLGGKIVDGGAPPLEAGRAPSSHS